MIFGMADGDQPEAIQKSRLEKGRATTGMLLIYLF